MCSGSPPASQDYVGAAKAQSAGTLQSTIANALLNRANQNTPYGSQTWTQTGTTHIPGTGTAAVAATPGHWEGGKMSPTTYDEHGIAHPGQQIGGNWIPGTAGSPGSAGTDAMDIPQFTSNITLSPQQQQLFDAQQARQLGTSALADKSLANAQGILSTPFSLDGTLPAFNQQVSDAQYARAKGYLDPQWEQSEAKERSRLANSGFSQQDDNYGQAIGNFDRAKNMAYETARNDAITTGNQIGLGQRQQDISERLLMRNQPLQELQALQGGSAPSIPSFPSTNVGANAEGANLLGAAQQQGNANNAIYNAQVGSDNATMQAAGGIASSALMAYLMAASDVRLKENIRRIGKTDSGIPVYIYNYIGDPTPQMGVMAQEVKEIQPDAVGTMDNGYLGVYYGRLQ